MSVTIKMEGFRELDLALGKLPQATAKRTMRKVLKTAAQPIADAASRIAPDDPATPAPDLHRSIGVSHRQKTGRQRKFTKEGKNEANMYVGPTADGYPQAMMQEFGTAHHSPQPYMRPAWDKHRNGALNTIKAELGKEIVKAAARLAKKRAKASR